jgi:signal transduction histidine kinase
MKLLAKTNIYYLVLLIALAPVMTVVEYTLICYLVNREINTILQQESERILFHLEKEGEIPNTNYWQYMAPLEETSSSQHGFRDTLIFEAYSGRLVPYRAYEFEALVGDKKHSISLRHTLLEMNKLIWWLFAATTLILALLAAGLFFVNRKISEWAWQPFYNNLSELKHYDISKKKPVHLESYGISEFEALNEVLTTLMKQVEKDFQQLKEFNENISHEMQTPLAIIRNKMVLLLESQHLSPKELQWVQSAYQEVNKLSKIGKSLTLISRIENQEFTRMESVDARATIENIMGNMEEIIQFKKLGLITQLDTVEVKCDHILINILFTNLIKNAISNFSCGGEK